MSQLKKQIDDVQNASPTAIILYARLSHHSAHQPMPQLEDAEAEEYIEPNGTQENLNLNDLSRQMLEKALERNNGNRKKAAQELGISDRTLYRRLKQYGLAVVMLLMLACQSCSVSYSFNGASIDYTKTKTIQIADFPIRSNYVWGPMASIFNNQLKDQYANHTKLTQVKRNGDLKLEGEITKLRAAQQVGVGRGQLGTGGTHHDGERPLHQQREARRRL